jgi:hypothetical protein
MSNINFKSIASQLKRLRQGEIVYSIAIGLSLTFLFSVWGIGFKMNATNEAFGDSLFLKYLVYGVPIFPLYILVKLLFNKYNNGNSNFKNSMLIYLFLVIVLSIMIKIVVRKPILFLQQDYIAYTVTEEQTTEGVVEKGKGIYKDDEIGEVLQANILENSVVLRIDKDEMPVTNQAEKRFVQKVYFGYWQTPVLLGYTPKSSLENQISFKLNPVLSVKDFFRYLLQIVPVFYLEMFQKSVLSYAFLLIVAVCFFVYLILKLKTNKTN